MRKIRSVLGALTACLYLQTASAHMSLAELLTLAHIDADYGISRWRVSADESREVVTDPSMDVLDIAQEPDGTLVGIYHGTNKFPSDPTRVLCLKLATAENIEQRVWTRIIDIDCTGGSQGSIKRLPGGEYLVAYEKKPSLGRIHSFVQILYFPNFSALKRNAASHQFTVPEWKGDPRVIQGTPNFREIHYSPNPEQLVIEIGYHVGLGGRGVNAIGTLKGFREWTYALNDDLNHKMTEAGVTHSIGGRAYLIYEGKPFTIVEGQYTRGDFQSFRLYLYDESEKTVTPLNIVTPAGGVAFGNPKLNYILHKNESILVGTAFSFNSGTYGSNHIFTRRLPVDSVP